MSKAIKVDMNNKDLFVTLEEAQLEESKESESLHGIYHSIEGSIYSYVEWFYDNDESAFEK
jgi:hypothetical protein